MEKMEKEELYQEILKRAQDNRIACRQCFEVAKECNISPKAVGDLCTEKSVKICACQLGCFK
ncbi:MAG: hypothetical protein KAJ46_08690 [Sedimentisphaerales bacterium]|nr:hypothetical protein [Sedimentisphaerales bacterium]